jgi:hypothetical protein
METPARGSIADILSKHIDKATKAEEKGQHKKAFHHWHHACLFANTTDQTDELRYSLSRRRELARQRMESARKTKRNYYTVNIPSDCTTDVDERFSLAIIEAKERARLYVIPANWRLISDDGENVRIVREH